MAEQKYFFFDMQPANVKGGSERPETKDWLELDNWNFSMSQTADPNVKGGKPQGASASGRFSFTIKHNGPQIFRNAANGLMIKGPLTFRAYRGGLDNTGQPGTMPTVKYFELVFKNVVVSGRSLSGDVGQKNENVDLVFEDVTMNYWQMVNGKAGPVTGKTYNCKTNIAG